MDIEQEAADTDRRRAAGVLDEVGLATKPQFAQRMLAPALDAGMPMAWVMGDEVYGGDRTLRVWLEERGQPFVLAIKSNEALWSTGTDGMRQRPAAEIARGTTETARQRRSAGDGAKGPRLYDWAWVRLARLSPPQWEHWLLVRRSLGAPTDLACSVVFAPTGTDLATLVRVAGARWTIEECLESAKGEVGLDQYEVRKWDGWYRHITLALLAHAYLSVTTSQISATKPTTASGKTGTLSGSVPGRMTAYRTKQRALWG